MQQANILCRIISDSKFKDTVVLLCKIKIYHESNNFSSRLIRTQFPIKLAWAITSNKSQCQSLTKVGIYFTLNSDVFSHGQLYVALSRAKGGPQNIAVFKRKFLKNVVYKSLL